jgi:hypothetical protein
MHLKVFLKLKNTKNSLFWANIYFKKTKTQKTPKKPKKPTGLVFLKKPGFFPTLPVRAQGVVPGEQAAAQLAQLQAQVRVRVGQVAALKEPVLAVALRHLRQREQDLHHRVLNQKRFIYRLLTRHGCLPVWLAAA